MLGEPTDTTSTGTHAYRPRRTQSASMQRADAIKAHVDAKVDRAVALRNLSVAERARYAGEQRRQLASAAAERRRQQQLADQQFFLDHVLDRVAAKAMAPRPPRPGRSPPRR